MTEEIRERAKAMAGTENEIKAAPASNSVGVLPFVNKTRDSEVDSLQNGLASMLIADLSLKNRVSLNTGLSSSSATSRLGNANAFGTCEVVIQWH